MKNYSIVFGSGDPRQYSGLNATLLLFVRLTDGMTLTPPSLLEQYVGTGFYNFKYGTTQPIAFLADAATTSPGSIGRYVMGQIDPSDRADEYGNTLTAIGFSLLVYGSSISALGTTNIALGTTAVSLDTTILAYSVSLYAASGTSSSVNAAIGTTASLIGDATTDPVDLYGYVKRIAELIQGQQIFTKGSGALAMYDRTGATNLVNRTVTNNSSQVIKS